MNNNEDCINLIDIQCEYDSQKSNKESEKPEIILQRINYLRLNLQNLFYGIRIQIDERFINYIKKVYNKIDEDILNNKIQDYNLIIRFQKKIGVDFLMDYYKYQKDAKHDKYDYIFDELIRDETPVVGDICLNYNEKYLFVYNDLENKKYISITIDTLLNKCAEEEAKRYKIINGKFIKRTDKPNIFELNSDKEKILSYFYDKCNIKNDCKQL